MSQFNIIWKPQEGRWSAGDVCYLGKWQVGHVYYDGGTSKDQQEKYVAKCFLPGVKEKLGHFMTKDLAYGRVETFISIWLSGLDKEPK